jgi:hypothetical protein
MLKEISVTFFRNKIGKLQLGTFHRIHVPICCTFRTLRGYVCIKSLITPSVDGISITVETEAEHTSWIFRTRSAQSHKPEWHSSRDCGYNCRTIRNAVKVFRVLLLDYGFSCNVTGLKSDRSEARAVLRRMSARESVVSMSRVNEPKISEL